MKITYLVKKKQEDGSMRLAVVSHQEWRAVVEKNKTLPAEQKRYFILDYIPDGSDMDKMVVEVPADMYREWHREHMASKRNRDLGKNYRHISLESTMEVKDVRADLTDMDIIVDKVSEEHRSQKILEMLRNSLAEWKPWAVDLLDFYLLGRRKDCTDVMAQKYGVSSRMVRKYKKQFENFIKKFFETVPFDPFL